MLEINWLSSGKDSYYAAYGNYILKRKTFKTGTTYQIWNGEVMEYNTMKYWDFMKAAKSVIKSGILDRRGLK